MDKFLEKIKIDKDAFIEILNFLFWAFVIMNISSLAIYSFGSSYFVLNYKDNMMLNNLISYGFLYLNLTIFIGIVFKNKGFKLLSIGFVAWLLYIGIYGIFFNVYFLTKYTNYISLIFPFVIVVIHSFIKKRIDFNVYLRLLLWYLLVGAFQLLELKYRGIFHGIVNYNPEMSYIEKIVIYTNSIIFQLLIYLSILMEVNKNEFILVSRRKFNFRFRQNGSFSTNSKILEIDSEFQEFFNNLSKPKQIIVVVYFVVIQIAQIVIICGLCILLLGINGTIQLFLVLIGFWFIRKILKVSFHFKNFIYCTIFSAFVFLTSVGYIPKIFYSTFINIILGGLIAISFYHLKLHLNSYNELKKGIGDKIDKEKQE